jgi:hypothetical protein
MVRIEVMLEDVGARENGAKTQATRKYSLTVNIRTIK